MKARALFAAVCIVMMIAVSAHQSNAQAAPGVYADAVHPAGPPDPTKLDSIWQVDPLTGSVSITIPFTTTPAGGRGPKIPFTLHYNSASTVTLQSQGSYSVGIPGIMAITTTTALTNIVQQMRWSPTPIGPTTGPVGPWTTSGPFLYSAATTIPNQNYTETVGNINVNINAGSGCTIYGPFIYTDESGAAHDMNLELTNIGSSNTNMAPPCSGTVSGGAFVPYGPTSATTDGSALATTWSQPIGDTKLNGFPPNILYPDGTQFYNGTAAAGGTLEDSNGNQAKFAESGNTWTATDSLGRAAFTTTIPVGYPGQIPPGNYNVTTSGENGNSESYSLTFSPISLGSFTMPNPIGGTLATAGLRNLGFCLTSITCTTEFGIIQPTAGSTLPALTQITLPDSTQYLFTYDTTYGTISKIEFPTGGYVRFVWGVRGDGGGYGAYWYLSTLVVTKACTSTGSGSENCWQYNFPSYSATSGLTSTVTAPDGSSTAYTGVPIFYTGVQLYQMAAAPSWKEASRLEYSSSGTLMKSVATTYWMSNGATGLPAQVATTLYDGPTPLQQYVQYTYDYTENPAGYMVSYANVVEKDESDFNPCTGTPSCPMPTTPPSFLRKTFTSYAYANNSAWVTAHIVNKPYQVLVTDGSGNPYSLTTYTYDQGGYTGSAPAGLSNYDYANFGTLSLPRGNLTTESKCISGITAVITPSGFVADCGPVWNTSYYYDGTGQLLQKVEGAGTSKAATTTYTWTEQNNGFLTQVRHPDGNTDLYTYWPYIGAMASHTDWNGQITNYDYTDPLNRIRTVTLAQTTDGTTGNAGHGTTTYNYNDSAGDFWVQEKHTVDTAGTTTSVTKYYDGLGRVVSAVTAVPTTQCSTGNIQVQTTYDTMSRVSSTSNPYCSTSDPTYGITQFAYDALGRKIKTTLPDGSISTIAYAGNATKTTDPPNGTTSVQHIQQSNGLGFLTNVCEVSASSLSSISTDTPSACGLNIAGSGYLTSYAYDPLGNMRSVNQHGLARSFTYDNLSRLLTALNPEVGTDTYTYSSSSSACSPSAEVPCARQDARGVITSYTYDSMSRLTSKSYSVASTNSTGAVSDLTSCYLYNTQMGTDANPKGALVAEWQQPQSAGSCGGSIPSSAVAVRIRPSHDAMGRVLADQQCLTGATSCLTATTGTGNFVYTYNLLGNPVQSNNGVFAASVTAAQVATTNATTMTAPSAPSVTWKTTYDMAGHINNVVVQDQPSTSVLPTSAYSFAPTPLLPTSYDAFGHMTAAQLGIPNGSSTAAVALFRQYDNRGRIAFEADSGETSSGASLASATLTYSGAEQSVTSGSTTTYDAGALGVVISSGQQPCVAVPSYGEYSTPDLLAEALAAEIDACSGVAATADGATVTIKATTPGAAFDYNIQNAGGHNPAFSTWSFTLTDSGSALAGGSGTSSGTIYSYQAAYAPNGNILEHVDSVMGTWNFTYDAVDRLMTATQTADTRTSTQYAGKYACWTYDSFGNRTLEAFSGVACTGTNPTPQAKAVYNQANNRIQSISGTTSASFIYDASGNTLYDGNNYYWYDAEGQLCAAQNAIGGTITQYVYDPEGARIAKGTLASAPSSYTATCAPPQVSGTTLTSSAGLSLTARYLVDQGGDQVTEFDNGNWAHSNIWAGGKLVATYDTKGIHYELADPLGTKRVQANALGQVDETCTSLPFGNDVNNPIGANCTLVANSLSTGDDATEHHFTQKERDTETGNDYFDARYYSSGLGRFTTPDWSAKEDPVPYAVFADPQSLNLYAYVRNNPLTRFDPDGHACKADDSLCQALAKAWDTIHGIANNAIESAVTKVAGPLPSKPTATLKTPVVPSANLHTDMSGNTTTFTSTNVFGQTKTDQIETHTDVDSHASPGAGGPFSTPNIGQVGNPNGSSKEMGPQEAYINTGDPRHRQIHGGGTGSPDPLGPNQGQWVPTMGCTRGINSDVINLGRSITATRSDPYENGATIPYSRY